MSAAVVAAVPRHRGVSDKENCHPSELQLPAFSLPVKASSAASTATSATSATNAISSMTATATVAAASRPVVLPPSSFARRSSSSILRCSVGVSSSGSAAAATSVRCSLPAARRKSVSFAAAMEEVRLFDSRHTATQQQQHQQSNGSSDDDGNDGKLSQSRIGLHTEHDPQQQQQQYDEQSDRATVTATVLSVDDGDGSDESMELTQLVSSTAASSIQQSAGESLSQRCPSPAPPVDMELTALLHTLPALLTAATRAARRTSSNGSSSSSSSTEHTAGSSGSSSNAGASGRSRSRAEPRRLRGQSPAPLDAFDAGSSLPSSVDDGGSCDLTDWLAPPQAASKAGGSADMDEPQSRDVYGDASMEMTELLSTYTRDADSIAIGSSGGSDSERRSSAESGEDEAQDGADMEMTAILSKWSERSHQPIAVSPFALRSVRRSSIGTSPLASPSRPPAASAAVARLPPGLLHSSPKHDEPQPARGSLRLCNRLSHRLSMTAAVHDNSSSSQQSAPSPASALASPSQSLSGPRSSLLTVGPSLPRLSVSAASSSRGSVGVPGMVGEQTAVLSARWLQMMDEQQSQQQQQRLSSASSMPVGDCTADIAAMLEAVLMDGQSTEEAMRAYQQQSCDRRQRHQPMPRQADDDEDENGDDEDDCETADVAALTASTVRIVSAPPQLLAEPLPLAESRSSAGSPISLLSSPSAAVRASPTAAAWSPLPPHCRDEDSVAASHPPFPPAPVSPTLVSAGGGLASFLDSAFHLLGVSSLDDSNLHAKLRKRDSSFQPASTDDGTDEPDNASTEGGTADAGKSPSMLEAIVRTVLAGEELDELQSACLQLMDTNAQLRDEAAERHSQLAQRHTAAMDAAQVSVGSSSGSSLHRFLAAVARQSIAAESCSVPSPSTALCGAALHHYALSMQSARLSWMQWQTALNAASAGKSDVGCRQLEADVDMAAELATMQATMHHVRQAAMQNERVRDSRQASLVCHRQCVAAQRQLAELADQSLVQLRLVDSLVVSLREEAIALQKAALSVEQQQIDARQGQQVRTNLSASTAVSRCRFVSATSSHVDIALQAAPYVVLRCARLDKQVSSAAQSEGGTYQLTRLPGEQRIGGEAFHLHGLLLQALLFTIDTVLSSEGKHVSLSAAPVVVRRCAAIVHRATQWQQSIDVVSKQYGSRLVVSLLNSPTPSSDFLLSVRCQSPHRNHQLVCRLTLSLDVEPRLATSILKHSLTVVSLEQDDKLDDIKLSLLQWISGGRASGYGQLQRIVSKLFDVLSAL